MKSVAFEYVKASGLEDAAVALQQDGAKVVAGCQSLGPMLNLRLARPSLLIDITGIGELTKIEERRDTVTLGACITHAAIEDGAVPDPTNGALPAVAANIAYRAIRNRGTIGGSLAHADPAADWPTALMALGAEAEIVGTKETRHVPVEDLVLGAFQTGLADDEILTSISIPRVSKSARFGFHKFCRKVGEFAEAMCAVLDDPERGFTRIVVATDSKPVILDGADLMIREPETIGDRVAISGLGGDAYVTQLRRAVIRRAIAGMQPLGR
ncbi:MAG: FAD binding domain-containing protein [Alphaproteobacteria bacterium]|nr:FAD binding domain-containing protein [Alphaproteobacteria bacterium]